MDGSGEEHDFHVNGCGDLHQREEGRKKKRGPAERREGKKEAKESNGKEGR